MSGPPPGGRLWIGVDLGTQSVKVSVVDDAGTIVSAGSAPYGSMRDGGRHEQQPSAWIAGVRDAMSVALSAVASAERRVGGLAICATSGTFAVVDGTGRATSTGIMYDDARAASLAAEADAADPALWRRLGHRIQPTWALPKIVWAERHRLLEGDRFVAHQGDVVASAMTGTRMPTDWSHALKSGYDLEGLAWPGDALARLGIDADRLPEVVAPGTPIGATSAAWEQATGLPAGTTVHAGMTDGCAAQLGAAAFALGDWHSVLGTTFVAKAVSDRSVADDSGAVYSHRAPHDGLWLPGGASNAGAGAVSRLLPGADLIALDRALADVPVGDIPLAYPLTTRGERFPVLRPDAEGVLVDGGREFPLDAAPVPPERLFGAVLLGVALVERLSVETLAAAGVSVDGRFSSSGGGTRNEWWTRLRADLLGRPIVIPRSAEGSVGMAILAAWGSDGGELPAVAGRMSRADRTVEPDDGRRGELEDLYGRFLALLTSKGWLTR